MAGIVQKGVVCERLIRNGVLNEHSERDFVYKMNKMGPRTEPCGTPRLSKVGYKIVFLTVTVCVLLER